MQQSDGLFYLAHSADVLIVAAVGVFTVLLGYLLFRDMPRRAEGETKVALPGGISIYISRVGPGVFFALFGATLIGYVVVSRPLEATHKNEERKDSSIVKVDQENLKGMNKPHPAAGSEPRVREVQVERAVNTLAELANQLATADPSQARIDKEVDLREARICLMREYWKAEWGDREDFLRWVTAQPGDPPPDSRAPAAAIYRGPAK